MALNDPLANALSTLLNAEGIGKYDCSIKPSSKLIKKVLDILQSRGYIQGYQEIEDGKGNMLKITISGKINKCGAIKPRHSATISDYEKFENRYLPAKDFGLLIVSTSQGIMTHVEAKDKKLGGKLLAYCY